MNYLAANIKITIPKRTFPLVIILILAACNPTKYVPDGEALLHSNNVVIDKSEEPLSQTISKGAMTPYIKQQPNKRIFGARFHLGLYNLSNIEKERWPHGWLRKIGEEPVIFDSVSALRSKDQLSSYLGSKGYFNARVDGTAEIIKKEAKVYYNVKPGLPYTIRNIGYEIEDTILYQLIMHDTMSCLVERGMIFDVELLQNERLRLEQFIRNRGFYAFSAEDIYFRVDSTLSNRQVDVYYTVSLRSSLDSQGKIVRTGHSMYRVRDVYVYPEFDPREALTMGDEYLRKFDTTYFRGIYFISPPGRQIIKPGVIRQCIYVMPGSLFTLSNAEQTQTHLADLKNHRLVNVNYVDAGADYGGNRGEEVLDCIIQLTPMNRQSFTIEFEGTNSGGNIGGAVNLIYQNKSLFRGAEQFSLKLKGAYEKLTKEVVGVSNSQEFGVDATLRLPKFLMPFPAKDNFVRKYDPRTIINLNFNYQKLPVYTRTIATTKLGYTWNGIRYTTNTLNPLAINVVKLPFIDPTFKAQIDTSSYLAYSYRDVMIIGGNYFFVFNNQALQRSLDYWLVKVGLYAAGNLLSLVYNTADINKSEDGTYHLLGQPFAQYVKAETDVSYHVKINDVSSVVYRLFTGVGWPYGNSKAMPFEEQYFGGGANDIRAWMVRTLGPGSFTLPDSVYNQTADIKLEANIEYRFKLFWILEGAVFADAGNIWTFREDPDRPGAQFKFNKFLDDLAVGTGLGLRFDLNYVLLRADVGLKLRDPASTATSKWIPFYRPYSFRDDVTLVIGIGYPF